MAYWTNKPDPDLANLLDQMTDFRLSRQSHNYPIKLEEIWWSVLIEIDGISIDQFELAVSDFSDNLLIPVAYDPEDREKVMARQPLTIFAREPLIKVLNRLNNPYQVVSIRLGAWVPENFLDHSASFPEMSEILVEDDAVVQAIIDDGIAIAHDLFRDNPVSSRFYHASIFDAEPRKSSSHTSVGRILDRTEINALLDGCTFSDILDEDVFYSKSGQVDLAESVFSTVATRTSHGTHITALASGHSIEHGCKNRPIICAALPSRIVDDTTGIELLPGLYLAFQTLVKQARRFRTHGGAKVPVVFNFSYGNTGGPHDGTGVFTKLFEYYFGAQVAETAQNDDMAQKIWLTLPAGNNNLGRLHAVNDLAYTADDVKLDLTILPDDRTPNHVQIWLPISNKDDQLNFATIHVKTPFGHDQGTIQSQPGQHTRLMNSAGKEIARLAYEYVNQSTQRGLITLFINPTAHLSACSDLAQAGLWTVEVCRNQGVSLEPIHIWVRRDETLPGHQPGGRQAYFSNPDYQRFGLYGAPLAVDPPNSNCPVRRSGTISGFACGPSPIAVAAYVEKGAELSVYSAAGLSKQSSETIVSYRFGPDVAAKADDSDVLRGVISAGSRSGTWVRLNGTSVASPRVSRLAAEHISKYPGSAREWSQKAAMHNPFELRGEPEITRAGAGGVKIATFSNN